MQFCVVEPADDSHSCHGKHTCSHVDRDLEPPLTMLDPDDELHSGRGKVMQGTSCQKRCLALS